MNLSKTEHTIERKIYLYPIFTALITSLLFIGVTYNFLEDFKQKEKNLLRSNLINKEKEIVKNQLEQVAREINFIKEQTI